jgi:hypothetical protein
VDEAMARKPITEPTKIWVTARFNLGKAIETYLRDYIEELQMGSLRIDEKTEDHLINRYLKEVYQRDLDSEFSPAEQKEMQKIFAYDPEFSKIMKRIFPSAKIRKDIIPMLKAPVEASADAGNWIVERLNPSSISVRGQEMQYLIIQHPAGIHLQGIYPNGMLRTFDEPKKRKNQKFTNPIEFTPETLKQALLVEGIPASFLKNEVIPLLAPDAINLTKLQMSSDSVIKRVKVNIADIPMVQETSDGRPAIRAKDLAKFNRVMQGEDLSRAEKIEQSQLDLEQIKYILSEQGRHDLWEILNWILEEDKRFNLFDIHVRDNLANIYDALIQNSDIASASKTMAFEDIQASLKMLRLPLFTSQEEAERLYWKRMTWQDFIDSKFGKIGSEIEINESPRTQEERITPAKLKIKRNGGTTQER